MNVCRTLQALAGSRSRSLDRTARRAWLSLSAASALLAATGACAQGASEPLPVFVSILPQKQIVERVGGDAVKVDVIVRPGQDAHTYEPTPAQVVALAQAKALFRIGMPFEERLAARLARTSPTMAIVDTRQGISLLTMVDHHHSHEHGHAKTPAAKAGAAPATPDPHIWTSPRLIKQQAATVRDALIALQPEGRGRFEAGYAAYARDLDALDAQLRQWLAGKAGQRFMVFHPSWGYLADEYGLQQIAIEVEGKEPSPKALARIIERAKSDGIRVVFVQPQFSRNAAQQVARAIGGEVVAIDPLAADLLGNLREVGLTLARNLR